ncbi:MAG: chorismate-binding protein [Candidatus Latescibacterota bacterium]
MSDAINAISSNFAHTLGALWRAIIDAGGSVALWHAPEAREIHLVGDLSPAPALTPERLTGRERGFLVAPFHAHDTEQRVLLKPDIHVAREPASFSGNIPHPLPPEIQMRFEGHLGEPNPPIPYHVSTVHCGLTDEKEPFVARVQEAKDAMSRGQMQKVALARKKIVALSADFDPVRTFLRLGQAYGSAFTTLLSIPGVGTWMGASPELLVGLSEDAIFTTVALAGTMPFSEPIKLTEVTWRQKEIAEQALVSRYIVDQFKKIRLREFLEDGPRAVQAGPTVHLRTDFSVDTKEVSWPDLGWVMLELLHPTSAVCGMPKETALAFLSQKEGASRKLYSGYLGPVNMSGGTQLYVNLRCMELRGDRAVLYAGAGITRDSDPTREWEETELKCRTLLDILRT